MEIKISATRSENNEPSIPKEGVIVSMTAIKYATSTRFESICHSTFSTFYLKKYILFVLIAILANLTVEAQLKAKDYVDQTSRGSACVWATKGTHVLWNATGFFYGVANKTYFITNNHVVGGKYMTDEYIRLHGRVMPTDSLPDSLHIRIYDTVLLSYFFANIPLFDGNNKRWLEFHDNPGDPSTLLDVVAIELRTSDSRSTLGTTRATAKDLVASNVILQPSQELFVIGFPTDAGQTMVYPIWKRGTIASEPNFFNLGNSKFYIDATTRQGMSGSPVYFRGSNYMTKDGRWVTEYGIREWLIGIYSAQSPDKELGVVTRFEKIALELSRLNP